MSLPNTLKSLIETEMVAQGFVLTGPYAMGSKIAAAIATAVENYLNANVATPFDLHTHMGDGGPVPAPTSPPIIGVM